MHVLESSIYLSPDFIGDLPFIRARTQRYCSTRCPAECGIFEETTTHVVLQTQ